MGWFMDVILGYMMNDVMETEFHRLKDQLKGKDTGLGSRPSTSTLPSHSVSSQLASSGSKDALNAPSQRLDFTTLQNFHSTYLERILSASLLTQPALASTIRGIFEACERFVGQVERWGDILPGLLTEGSISEGTSSTVGSLVKERQKVVKEIDQASSELFNNDKSLLMMLYFQNLKSLFETFYEQLSSTTSQTLTAGDASKSIWMNATIGNVSSSMVRGKRKGLERDGETRRHIERLLLQLDFNRMFSKPGFGEILPSVDTLDILKEGGLA